MNNLLWICASVGGFLLYMAIAFVLACIFLNLTTNDLSEEDFPIVLCALQSVAALFAIIFYTEQFFNK